MRLTDARQLKWNSWLYDSWILIPGKVHSIYIYHVTKFASYLWQVRGPWFNRNTVESCLKHPLKKQLLFIKCFFPGIWLLYVKWKLFWVDQGPFHHLHGWTCLTLVLLQHMHIFWLNKSNWFSVVHLLTFFYIHDNRINTAQNL